MANEIQSVMSVEYSIAYLAPIVDEKLNTTEESLSVVSTTSSGTEGTTSSRFLSRTWTSKSGRGEIPLVGEKYSRTRDCDSPCAKTSALEIRLVSKPKISKSAFNPVTTRSNPATSRLPLLVIVTVCSKSPVVGFSSTAPSRVMLGTSKGGTVMVNSCVEVAPRESEKLSSKS